MPVLATYLCTINLYIPVYSSTSRICCTTHRCIVCKCYFFIVAYNGCSAVHCRTFHMYYYSAEKSISPEVDREMARLPDSTSIMLVIVSVDLASVLMLRSSIYLEVICAIMYRSNIVCHENCAIYVVIE